MQHAARRIRTAAGIGAATDRHAFRRRFEPAGDRRRAVDAAADDFCTGSNESLKMLRTKLSSAGFASSVPILGGARIERDAEHRTRAAVAGLHDMVLAKMAKPRASVRAQRSVRRAPVKAGSGLAMAGVAAVVAVAAAAVWAIPAKETPPAKPVAAAEPAALANARAAGRRRSWLRSRQRSLN